MAILGAATGVTAALVSVAAPLWFPSLPVANPESVVHLDAPVWRLLRDPDLVRRMTAAVNAAPLADRASVKTRAVFQEGSDALVEWGLSPVFVSPEFFALVGRRPAIGRAFDRYDATSKPRPVILGDRLWRTRFAADLDIVGRLITIPGSLEESSWRVIGVMPPGFDFPRGANLWLPYDEREFGASLVPDFARLVQPASLRALEAYVHPVVVTPLRRYLRPDGAVEAAALFGTAVVLLLIAWTQAAALLIARSAARRQELAVRWALGAGRSRLFWELLQEGAIIALAASAIGFLTASPVRAVMLALVPPEVTVQSVDVAGSTALAALLLGCAGLAVWAAVCAPLARRAAAGAWLTHMTTAPPEAGDRTRSTLFLLQVAGASALVVLAGAGVRSFQKIARLHPGFEPAGLVAFSIPLPISARTAGTAERRQLEGRYAELARQSLHEVSVLPGVRSVAFASGWPMASAPERVLVEGRDGSAPIEAVSRQVGIGYVRTIGAHLVDGAEALADDTLPRAMPGGGFVRGALVNRALATRLGEAGRVVGRTISLSGRSALLVTGVLADVEDESLDGRVPPTVYPYIPATSYGRVLLVRVARDADVAAVGAALHRIWGGERQWNHVVSAEAILRRAVAEHEARSRILMALAVPCLPLVILGVTAAVRLNVDLRRHDLAVRLALGQPAHAMQRGLALRTLSETVLGVTAGVMLGAAAVATAGRMLPGISGVDTGLLAACAILLAATATGAAWRAAGAVRSVDLSVLLRR